MFYNKPIKMVKNSKGVYEETSNPDAFDIIKLVDFGTADYWKNEYLSDPFGSAAFMAPEIFDKKYDLKVDVWSIGVILFCMIMVRLPFDGENDNEVINSIMKK